MKKLFAHENRLIVFNLKNLLKESGIECRVFNEFAAGGVGELATFDTWPELWVEDDAQFQRAEAVLEQVLARATREDWYCRGCQEKNAAAFEVCWNCGREYE